MLGFCAKNAVSCCFHYLIYIYIYVFSLGLFFFLLCPFDNITVASSWLVHDVWILSAVQVYSHQIHLSFKSTLKSHLFNLSHSLCVCVCVYVCVHVCVCARIMFYVLFASMRELDSFVLCLKVVMGYMLQFGEIALIVIIVSSFIRKRTHYYYYFMFFLRACAN